MMGTAPLELLGGLPATLLRASVEGALAVALVALLVRALPALPARVRCALWWAACLKLVLGLGVAWVAPVELPVLPAAAGAVPGFQGSAASRLPGPAGPPSTEGTTGTAGTGSTAAPVPISSAGAIRAGSPGGPVGPPSPVAGTADSGDTAVRDSRAGSATAGNAATGKAAAPPGLPATGSVPVAPATALHPGELPARAGTATSPAAASLAPLLRPLAGALGLLWVLGLAVAVAAGWRRHRRLVRVLEAAATPDDPALAARLERLARRFGVTPPPLQVTGEVESPQVVGVLRPRLLLPAGAARRTGDREDRELDLVLAHELAHLRRRDLLLGWIPALARGLFFFHPLAALAAREYSLAREAACDAEVLHRLGAAPHDYGRMLLTWGAVRHGGLPAAAFGDHRQLKRRLIMLENTSKNGPSPRPWIVLAAALPVVLLLLPVRLVAAPDIGLALDGPPVHGTAPEAAGGGTASAPSASASGVSAATASAPRVPAAPPAPAAPAPPVALPALPSAPPLPGVATVAAVAPPPPAGPGSHWWFWSGDDEGEPVVYVEGDRKIGFHSSTRDSRRIETLRRGDEALLWFVRDGEEYVVRDPAVLARAEAAWKPVMELGRKQGELGGEQGELGGEQGELGAEQGKLGAQQGRIAAQQARLAAELAALAVAEASAELAGEGEADREALQQRQAEMEARIEALSEQQRALGEQQRALGRQQEALAARQRAFAEQQRALGEQQREAGEAARGELERILDEALRSGKAQPVD